MSSTGYDVRPALINTSLVTLFLFLPISSYKVSRTGSNHITAQHFPMFQKKTRNHQLFKHFALDMNFFNPCNKH